MDLKYGGLKCIGYILLDIACYGYSMGSGRVNNEFMNYQTDDIDVKVDAHIMNQLLNAYSFLFRFLILLFTKYDLCMT